MKYGGLFLLFGFVCGIYAVQLRGAAWLLLWPAGSFASVGLAYLCSWPGVFGKRADGRMAVGSRLLLFPYLAYLWGVWHVLRLFQGEAPFNDLVPGIVIGRRLLPSEVPENLDRVLDLTCEFEEPRRMRGMASYRCFPILDGWVPKSADLVRLIDEVKTGTGTLYIHCAEGHGRTALVSAALLIAMGLTLDPRAAIAIVQAKRPRARVNKGQFSLLAKVAEALRAPKQNALADGFEKGE